MNRCYVSKFGLVGSFLPEYCRRQSRGSQRLSRLFVTARLVAQDVRVRNPCLCPHCRVEGRHLCSMRNGIANPSSRVEGWLFVLSLLPNMHRRSYSTRAWLFTPECRVSNLIVVSSQRTAVSSSQSSSTTRSSLGRCRRITPSGRIPRCKTHFNSLPTTTLGFRPVRPPRRSQSPPRAVQTHGSSSAARASRRGSSRRP